MSFVVVSLLVTVNLVTISGFHMTALVSPCADSLEFFNNSTGLCTECKVCRSSEVMVQSCGENTDTVCKCKSGWFSEHEEESCRECRRCSPGTTEISPCTATSNAQCSECPKGSFWGGSLKSCQICSTCAPNEVVLQPCSRLFDTQCISRDKIEPELKRTLRIHNHGRRLPKDIPAVVHEEKPVRASFWRISECSEDQVLYYLAPGFIIVVAVCYATFRVIQESDCKFPPIFHRSPQTTQQPLLPPSSSNTNSSFILQIPTATTPSNHSNQNDSSNRPIFNPRNSIISNEYSRLPLLTIQPPFPNFSLSSQPDPFRPFSNSTCDPHVQNNPTGSGSARHSFLL